MTLEEIYYIGQTIAVVAILASLGAIWFQQRQANQIARTQNLSLVSNYLETLRAFMENEDLAEIFRKVMFEDAPLSANETTRIMFYFNLLLSTHRDIWTAHVAGLAEQRWFDETAANTAWYLSKRTFLNEWRRLQANGQFADEFGDHINGLIARRNEATVDPASIASDAKALPTADEALLADKQETSA